VLTTLLSLTDADREICGHLAVLISEACANAVVHAELDSAVEVIIVIDDHNCLIEVGNRGSTPDGGPPSCPAR
jgi:serine/threonine-protein kinase RsbW